MLPKLSDEVMSFRVGSCAVVLARKYVFALLAMTCLIGGVHWVRRPWPQESMRQFGERSPICDFLKDCGFKTYLGNPIHVTVAFNEKFKNKTLQWQGAVHRVEEGFNLLGFSQPSAIFVDMEPQQFPLKRDVSDLVLFYKQDAELASKVRKFKRGA
ncbi:unnamed protein product, partial [Effrenium voratum]